MNKNELADELVWIAKNRGDSVSRQLADIVRQQQAEIEAYEKFIKGNPARMADFEVWMSIQK